MPETEAMVLNQARFGPCRAHPFPMNVDVGMSPFNWMFCDPNTMAVWKKEGGKDDYSLLVNRVYVFLLITIARTQDSSWLVANAQ